MKVLIIGLWALFVLLSIWIIIAPFYLAGRFPIILSAIGFIFMIREGAASLWGLIKERPWK